MGGRVERGPPDAGRNGGSRAAFEPAIDDGQPNGHEVTDLPE